ncbi:NUDIX domain-containing protein [Hyphomicrobium sp.]|uniref:NUDIX domain-containing protein n=1 Tax=Hyphomicrobium sp. TaxID=82 RepID=UPI002D772CBC|nr:NUDIX domain-containing protein [Hyphomicrobium sp.]HET6390027.1 NUDIX domain-containing protein [Hyphomicrobium sp.]
MRKRPPLREDRFLLGYVVTRAFQQFWRATRGLFLDVEACVLDEANRILLVRHDAGGPWHLPSTAVRDGESLEMALRRLLRDLDGIEVNSRPELRGFSSEGCNRQMGLYVVRNWQRLSTGGKARDMANGTREARFFPLDALPAHVIKRAAERISRLSEARTIPQT